MPTIEVTLPDHVDSEIDRLVEQGDFINRDQAIDELLSLGVSAHGSAEPETTEPEEEELFTQTIEDQQDPAARNEPEDEGPTF